MKLQYLGTAAAEGIPGMFCDCPVCTEARKRGGRDIRTRCQALVDDRLLLDYPPDSWLHGLQYGLDLGGIHTLLVTHDHSDHLYPEDLSMRAPGYSHPRNPGVLTVYGSHRVGMHLNQVLFAEGMTDGSCVRFCEIQPCRSFEAEGYTITALPARHDVYSGPYIYLISKGGRTLLYGHDTGPWMEEAWTWLEESHTRLDWVSLDCTEGDKPIDYDGHCNLSRCVAIRRRLLEEGIAGENTACCLNHFSHNGGHVLYGEMLPLAEAAGFRLAYDGLTVEF